ncbi:hypothetical protein [Streptomyces lavendulae]|uniref:hypothetical protein n=1 Tax=Streptomyces lavendulae TaxID=1914 RepID=UPI000A64B7D5|nr:hypothetical protein [Streptomyces lavendulae]
MPDDTKTTTADAPAAPGRKRLVSGPGLLLVWLYGVMVVGAVSRSAYQISTEFDRAPLAYALSGAAALAYAFITYSLVRGGEKARKAALVCCAAELAGVLAVGTWTLVRPESFPDPRRGGGGGGGGGPGATGRVEATR